MLDLSRIRAITLDLDDTLWPVWPTIARAEARLVEWLQGHAPRAAALAQDRELQRQCRQAVHTRHPERLHDLSFLRLMAIRELLEHAGEAPDLAEPAFEVFFAERQRVDLYDDVVSALDFLSARAPLVALSNGNADVHRVGIGQHFHASISARQVGVAKPDVRIFHAAAQAADVPPEAVLHIGDDAHHDVEGALQAGMQSVWVNRQAQPWSLGDRRAHLEVPDLAALCRYWQATDQRTTPL